MTVDHQEEVNLARDHSRQRPFLELASLFEPRQIVGYQKIRVGSPFDGGYVMLDDFSGVALALSLGVELNADWDLEIAGRGIPVQQYDHSVSFGPVEHSLLAFHRKMIVPAVDCDTTATLDGILSEMKINQDASVILKMDIEDAEWDVLDACSPRTLAKFSQILIEFHNFDRGGDPYWLRRAGRVLKKLREQFSVFHVHANNWSPMAVVGNVYFPSTLEVSFGNSKKYSSSESSELFPTSLDRPNNPLRPDIYLGSFRFRPI